MKVKFFTKNKCLYEYENKYYIITKNRYYGWSPYTTQGRLVYHDSLEDLENQYYDLRSTESRIKDIMNSFQEDYPELYL